MAISEEELARRKRRIRENGDLMDQRRERLQKDRMDALVARLRSAVPGAKIRIERLDDMLQASPQICEDGPPADSNIHHDS